MITEIYIWKIEHPNSKLFDRPLWFQLPKLTVVTSVYKLFWPFWTHCWSERWSNASILGKPGNSVWYLGGGRHSGKVTLGYAGSARSGRDPSSNNTRRKIHEPLAGQSSHLCPRIINWEIILESHTSRTMCTKYATIGKLFLCCVKQLALDLYVPYHWSWPRIGLDLTQDHPDFNVAL